jgi:hypothetical protein
MREVVLCRNCQEEVSGDVELFDVVTCEESGVLSEVTQVHSIVLRAVADEDDLEDEEGEEDFEEEEE